VAVEERELLLAVRGVVGGIHIDRDSRDTSAQAPPLLRDHGVGEDVHHGAHRPPAHRILEARQRGLRGQAESREGIAAHHQLVDRVVDQPGGIVAVGVARTHPEDALLPGLPAGWFAVENHSVAFRDERAALRSSGDISYRFRTNTCFASSCSTSANQTTTGPSAGFAGAILVLGGGSAKTASRMARRFLRVGRGAKPPSED
jgi:hypothetical protein